MEITETFYAPDRQTWRKWLEEYHEIRDELWLIYYKKHTGRPNVTYEESVQEALRFGWIDSLIKSMDQEKYVRKFTPRKPGSRWSDTNRDRVKLLLDQGLMTEAGLRSIGGVDLDERTDPPKGELTVPDYIREGFSASKEAFDFFNGLAPSRKRMFVLWIDSAKREETRQKRLLEAVRLCSEHRLLPMM